MDPQKLIQRLLGEFRDKLKHMVTTVERDVKFPDAPNKIKVAMGMRRAGKTTFVFQKIQELLKNGIPINQVLYLNFEDDRLLPLDQAGFAQLIDAFYTLFPENHDKKCYLFFDEVQNIKEWPLVVRRFHDSKNVEIYLTGSSAKLLSKEISTSLRGRSLSTEIWPFSFSEFLRAKECNIESKLYDKKNEDLLRFHFNTYLQEGGFPEVTNYNPHTRQQTLQEYIDVVIYRDIIERHDVKNPALIKYLILSMIHNVSKPFAINKFYNEIHCKGYRTGKDILYEYVHHIEDAYLAFSIPLFDPSIRKVQTNPKKVFAVDPGLVRAVTLETSRDIGKLFENVIYLDLRRKGCDVSYYLTQERFEIDFVAKSPGGETRLIQVAWNVDDPKTLEREKRALRKATKELGISGEIVTLNSYTSFASKFGI